MTETLVAMLKLSPLRHRAGNSTCGCCGEPMFLVQSRSGGFVTKSCKCGNWKSLNEREFYELDLWIFCPTCKIRMTPTRAFSNNYAYRCDCCQEAFKLADILPDWDQL